MSRPVAVLLVLIVAAIAVVAYLFWPVAPGVYMKVTVSNESPTATPSLVVYGPSAAATIGVVPPGKSRTVSLNDPRFGSVFLRSDTTPTVLGLFDLADYDWVTGAAGSLDIRWTGVQPDPGATIDHREYGFVDLGVTRYRGMGPDVIGGVWPLRADDGTTSEDY